MTHRFLPWLRRGFGAASGVRTVGVTLSGVRSTVQAHLRGPGDVLALEPSAVRRIVPAAGDARFPWDEMPWLELSEPDLPWRYSPVEPDTHGRLAPWLALIAVDADEVQLTDSSLTVPGAVLPPLDESWAWAHLDVEDPEGDLDTFVIAHPERCHARILCARRLEPESEYLLALVPTFEAARRAGLGLDLAGAGTLPAWSGDEPSVSLPAYASWSFSTGTAGFEALARALQPWVAPPDTASVAVELRGRSGIPSKTVQVPCILKPPRSETSPADPVLSAALAERVQPPPDIRAPVLGLPLIGAAQSGEMVLPDDGWLREVNSDAAMRTGAALGCAIVRLQQEMLAAAAFRQLAGAERVNQRLARGKLALAVAKQQIRRWESLDGDALLQITAPLHDRLRDPTLPTHTLGASLRAASLPSGVTAPALRRLARAGGTVEKALRKSGSPSSAARVAQVLRTGRVKLSALPVKPSGAMLRADAWLPNDATETASGFTLATRPRMEARRIDLGNLRADLGNLRSEIARRNKIAVPTPSLLRIVPPSRGAPYRPPPVSDPTWGTAAARLRAALDPTGALLRRLRWEIQGVDAATTSTVAANVSFTTPLALELAALAPRFFSAAAAVMPMDALTLLEADARMVEAVLVGANQEWSREMIWRGLPGRASHTAFRCFWGGDGIDAIDSWSDSTLGTHANDVLAAGGLALLLRGRLLERYPGTRIYAVIGEWHEGARRPAAPYTPSTAAIDLILDGSTRAIGFGMTRDAARGAAAADGSAGWYLVLEQPGSQPRFGLELAGDAPSFPSPPAKDAAHVAAAVRKLPFRLYVHARALLP